MLQSTLKYQLPIAVVALTLLAIVTGKSCRASSINGFDILEPLVPADEILHGGPPRDGIPSIDKPRFVNVAQADFLFAQDRVLGIHHNNLAKAYPIRILNYHEIVNDVFGDDALVVSFCPLCGTGMVFDANVAGRERSFGVSGLLYNSDMLLYDRESQSLWSQILMRAINGPLKGEYLSSVPVMHTTWADWKMRYPDTKVLSTDTGYVRNYDNTPYPGYTQSEDIMFPVSGIAAEYHPKERVLGLRINETAKAYPFVELSRPGRSSITDKWNGMTIRIEYDAQHQSAQAFDVQGRVIPSVTAFWFAWYAFYPQTTVFRSPR